MQRYSHIRIDAKRQALDRRDAARRSAALNGNWRQGNDAGIETVVEVPDELTSQLQSASEFLGGQRSILKCVNAPAISRLTL